MSDGTCNYPGCDNPAKTRGVCSKHDQWRYSAKQEKRDEIEQYLDPPKPPSARRPKSSKPKPAPAPAAQPPADGAAESFYERSLPIVTELVTALGGKHLAYDNGFLIETRTGCLLYYGPPGVLRKARVDLRPAL